MLMGNFHVAIIMDGNGRWAQSRGHARYYGHVRGAQRVREVVEGACHLGIGALTLYAFSTENWNRPEEAVSALINLFLKYLEKELKSLARAGVRLQVIGEITAFSQELQDRILEAVNATSSNNDMVLTVAVNYGGRWDIVQAIQKWQETHPSIDATEITQDQLAKFLSTANMPDPDLLIRTGGEQRISNFLLWQLAYTELYFCNVMWPEFNTKQLMLALDWYRVRNRRFGWVRELS